MLTQTPHPEQRSPMLLLVAEALEVIQPRQAVLFASLVLALIFAVDEWTPPQLNLTFLYVPVVMVVSWACGARRGLQFALLCFTAQMIAMQESTHARESVFYLIALGNRLLVYVLVVGLMVQLRQLYEVARDAIRHDPLTGVPNRMMFEQLLGRSLQRCRSRGTGLSIGLIDCDHFRNFNDHLGYATGDEVLYAVAEILDGHLDDDEVVARIDGDEFAILLPDSDPGAAAGKMQRLKELLDSRMRNGNWPLTFSIGVTSVTSGLPSCSEILSFSDAVLERVKRGGTNGLSCASMQVA